MSDYIEIEGEKPLNGVVKISGAKNAALPQLIATLLTAEQCEFENVPALEDVSLTLHLLEHFGGQAARTSDKVKISVPHLLASEASYSLVKALRASFWVLAPLLARGRAARVALPGGDKIGARPVDMHLEGLAQMGADIKVKHGVVLATAVDGLRPADIQLRFPSVGATHQLLMAAALVPGTSIIRGAAREPEVEALASMLMQMGADIEGTGTATIIIRGKEELGGAKVRLIGDRIEAGTYLLAGAAAGGSVRVNGVNPLHFGEFLDLLSKMNLDLEYGDDYVQVTRAGDLKPVDAITGPFPRFATDLQAPLMAALCFASGISTIEETVYEGRFGHVSELCRMGAKIQVDQQFATIHGQSKMSGAEVDGHDIRAAASLVVAALGSNGTSVIYEPHHLRRGYEALEAKFSNIGARIGYKITDPEDFVFTGC
ncbi:MAG: UDP-N-acetylglucosamine 1-carboxyvinyltransferase [Deltaproteobacteria bacterium]|nr:UDP-N-acetylglucosamine 1-carboxyvinyltransferase [Deltaproteobacteria bacterium]